MRFCIDYRKVNDLIKKDKFPLPKIDTCLDMLNGSKYFSSCDLRQGYWQTMIDERDRDKTAFVTRKGQWRFKVLSFGLCNAPSQFARTMELVLSGLTWAVCLVYLDDILVFSRTFEEHCDRLAAVFERLERHTLKLKPSKCHLFQRKLTFLGHVVSENGIECDPDKVAAIAEWPRPTNVSEVRTFCGLASYYRVFVPNFAHVAGPLHELTRKNAPFEWTEARERAFLKLKHCLSSAPVLSAPQDEGTFYLDTDASDTALGAVCQQQQDGVLRVIGYASRALSDAERRYCITRRELLGVVYGLKKFRQHLLGRSIVVRTDHAALTYLQKTPEPIGQQGRWLDLLGEFHITIQHRPGRVHGNSDALSRRPCDRGDHSPCRQCPKLPQSGWSTSPPVGQSGMSASPVVVQSGESASRVGQSAQSTPVTPTPTDAMGPSCAESDRSVSPGGESVECSTLQDDRVNSVRSTSAGVVADVGVVGAEGTVDHSNDVMLDEEPSADHSSKGAEENTRGGVSISFDTIRAAQSKDDGLSSVIELVVRGVEPEPASIRQYTEEARTLLAQWASLVVRDGILYRRFHLPDGTTKYLQVILPAQLRRGYIEQLHAELGHFGQAKTCAAVARRVYFPGWRSYTNLVVKNCTVCNLHQRGRQSLRQTPLKPMHEFRPMAVIHADLVGPLPEGRNSKNQRGFRYILSVIDSATRYLWLMPLRYKTADAVAAALFDDVITRVSVPSAILTDQGGEFTGEVMQCLCRRLGVDHLRTSAYHPQTDAKCERVHYSVHNMIVKMVGEQHEKWPDLLGAVALAYNSTIHTATSYSPHELFYSFQPSCPLDVLVDTPSEGATDSADAYALQAAERLREAYTFVRTHTQKQAERMKKYYDASIKPRVFKEGDSVLLYTPKRKRGVYSRWQVMWLGPYRVMRRLNSTNYVVQKTPRSKAIIVHADRLKPFHGDRPSGVWGGLESTRPRVGESDVSASPPVGQSAAGSVSPVVGESGVSASPPVGESAWSAGPPAGRPSVTGTGSSSSTGPQAVGLRPRRSLKPPQRLLSHIQVDKMSSRANLNESSDCRSFVSTRRNRHDPEYRRHESESRSRRARTADHINEYCALCDNPETAYYTVTGLNRHCVVKHGYTFRAAGHRYVPIDRERLQEQQSRVRAAQRPRRRRRGDPADKPASNSAPSVTSGRHGSSVGQARETSDVRQHPCRVTRVTASATSRDRDWSPDADHHRVRRQTPRRTSPPPSRRLGAVAVPVGDRFQLRREVDARLTTGRQKDDTKTGRPGGYVLRRVLPGPR